MKKVLGLDVSTTCIGVALFDEKGGLEELKHISPKVKPKPEKKIGELIGKADAFHDFLLQYKDRGIDRVIIEEPLLRSNNVHTVGTLLRFNGIICKIVSDVLGVTPDFISSYDARKYAFPELMGYRIGKTGKRSKTATLFGGHPKDIDKKHVIWEMVADREPQIIWDYTKYNTLKKTNYDMADGYVCVLGFMRKEGLWE